MNATQLQMEIRDIKTRTQLAGVLDRRADVLDRILIFAAALAVTLALWHALTLLARRFWNIEGRNRVNAIWHRITEIWRRLVVFASIVWGVAATLIVNPQQSADFALVIGPFVISVAVYLLFPKRQN